MLLDDYQADFLGEVLQALGDPPRSPRPRHPPSGSSSIKSLGRPRIARPIASIFRSPPDNVPACCGNLDASLGKKSNAMSKLLRSCWVVAPSARFSRHGQRSEHRLLLGNVAQPPADAVFGAFARAVLPVEDDAPAHRFYFARERLQQRRLTGPVPAEDRDRSSARCGQGHIEQHAAAPVAGGESVDGENAILRHGWCRPPVPCWTARFPRRCRRRAPCRCRAPSVDRICP